MGSLAWSMALSVRDWKVQVGTTIFLKLLIFFCLFSPFQIVLIVGDPDCSIKSEESQVPLIFCLNYLARGYPGNTKVRKIMVSVYREFIIFWIWKLNVAYLSASKTVGTLE